MEDDLERLLYWSTTPKDQFYENNLVPTNHWRLIVNNILSENALCRYFILLGLLGPSGLLPLTGKEEVEEVEEIGKDLKSDDMSDLDVIAEAFEEPRGAQRDAYEKYVDLPPLNLQSSRHLYKRKFPPQTLEELKEVEKTLPWRLNPGRLVAAGNGFLFADFKTEFFTWLLPTEFANQVMKSTDWDTFTLPLTDSPPSKIADSGWSTLTFKNSRPEETLLDNLDELTFRMIPGFFEKLTIAYLHVKNYSLGDFWLRPGSRGLLGLRLWNVTTLFPGPASLYLRGQVEDFYRKLPATTQERMSTDFATWLKMENVKSWWSVYEFSLDYLPLQIRAYFPSYFETWLKHEETAELVPILKFSGILKKEYRPEGVQDGNKIQLYLTVDSKGKIKMLAPNPGSQTWERSVHRFNDLINPWERRILDINNVVQNVPNFPPGDRVASMMEHLIFPLFEGSPQQTLILFLNFGRECTIPSDDPKCDLETILNASDNQRQILRIPLTESSQISLQQLSLKNLWNNQSAQVQAMIPWRGFARISLDQGIPVRPIPRLDHMRWVEQHLYRSGKPPKSDNKSQELLEAYSKLTNDEKQRYEGLVMFLGGQLQFINQATKERNSPIKELVDEAWDVFGEIMDLLKLHSWNLQKQLFA